MSGTSKWFPTRHQPPSKSSKFAAAHSGLGVTTAMRSMTSTVDLGLCQQLGAFSGSCGGKLPNKNAFSLGVITVLLFFKRLQLVKLDERATVCVCLANLLSMSCSYVQIWLTTGEVVHAAINLNCTSKSYSISSISNNHE